jgi:SAM-dependent methyltransferase
VSEEDWEKEAENWVRWARTPDFDGYWYYRDEFFENMVPLPGRHTLEIGCGEGRVARDLKSRGHRVVGVDSSQTLLRYAQEADPDGEYLVANAAGLPFEPESFDLVVAYNSLMDVSDLPGTVREASRVLQKGGRFSICVTHPTFDAGSFTSDDPDAPFVISGSYLLKRRFAERFERDGLEMNFTGWCYPLQDYFRAFEAAGLLVEKLAEPTPDPVVLAKRPRSRRLLRIPNFLMLRTVKPA